MTDTEREEMLSRWAEPPSNTEQTRCENAERVIKKAIAESDLLNQKNIRVFAQGSYRNNTNGLRKSGWHTAKTHKRNTTFQSRVTGLPRSK